MQTFLPYKSFKQSLASLDYRRLGKQRVEAMQLINSTIKLERGEPVKGWVNHPARIMWVGYLDALKVYHNLAIKEWISRGYKNNMLLYSIPGNVRFPHWLGDERIHLSHKSNLIRKMPDHYGLLWPDVPPDIPYFWPAPCFSA